MSNGFNKLKYITAKNNSFLKQLAKSIDGTTCIRLDFAKFERPISPNYEV